MMLKFSSFKVISVLLVIPFMVMSSRYEYLLFENFELTKKVFLNEQEIVRNLRIIKNDLSKKMVELNRTINYNSHVEDCSDKSKQLVHNFEYQNNSYLKKTSNFFRYEKTFLLDTCYSRYRALKQNKIHHFNYDKNYSLSSQNVMNAAQKGIIMLQETYDQKVTEYSAGHLRFKNGIELNSRKIDSLQPDDLAVMSTIAFKYFHWYDTSLKYLKAAIDMFFSLSKEKRDELPNTLEKSLLAMRKQYPSFHNDMFNKKSNPIGPDWKVYPYTVDTETMEAQSNGTNELTEFVSILKAIKVDREQHQYLPNQLQEPLFQNVCNGKIKAKTSWQRFKNEFPYHSKCHFVHHFTPFLKLGPFHLEVKLYLPFRTVIHDFFTGKEMDWMLEYSKPRLTTSRKLPASTLAVTKSDLRYKHNKKTGFTVAKAVTTWFNDIRYNETQEYIRISEEGEPLAYEHPPLNDPYNYVIEHETMHGISRKIELATNFNVTTRHGASRYQTTNYGLSGMVVTHLDAWGYERGVKLVEDRHPLTRTGDYIATFMGWFQDTQAGGNTAFTTKEFEGTVEPTKGSAAFWMNLLSCHIEDHRSIHGGCPVLKGSKWILNKWINSWDQWKKWPCDLVPGETIRPFEGMSS